MAGLSTLAVDFLLQIVKNNFHMYIPNLLVALTTLAVDFLLQQKKK